MTTKEPFVRAAPGATLAAMALPSVLMMTVGSFEVKLETVLSNKMKFRPTTALGNRLVLAGGKIRALIVLFALKVIAAV